MKKLTEDQISKIVTRVLISVLVLLVFGVSFFAAYSTISPKLANKRAEKEILDAISSKSGIEMVDVYKKYTSDEQQDIIIKYVDELAIDAMTDIISNDFDSGNDMENYINNKYGTLFFYNDNQNLYGDFSDIFYTFFDIIYNYYNNVYNELDFLSFDLKVSLLGFSFNLEIMSDFERADYSEKYKNIKEKIEKIEEEQKLKIEKIEEEKLNY